MREGHLRVLPVRGKNSPADFLTNAVSGVLREWCLKRLGFIHVAASTKHKELLGDENGDDGRLAGGPARRA